MFFLTLCYSQSASLQEAQMTSNVLLCTYEVCRCRSYFVQISEQTPQWAVKIQVFPMKRIGQKLWVTRDRKLFGGKGNLLYKYGKFWNWRLYTDLHLEAWPYFVADDIRSKQCLVIFSSCCIHSKLCQIFILNLFNRAPSCAAKLEIIFT